MIYRFKKEYRIINDLPFPIGGKYVCINGDKELELTDYSVVVNHRDHRAMVLDYMTSFFGGPKNSDNGYVAEWPDEVDNEAKIYYTESGEKVFATKYLGFSVTNIGDGIQYIIKQHKKMYDCIPDSGDLLFDSLDELSKYLSKNK